jgi:hypothetical protein
MVKTAQAAFLLAIVCLCASCFWEFGSSPVPPGDAGSDEENDGGDLEVQEDGDPAQEEDMDSDEITGDLLPDQRIDMPPDIIADVSPPDAPVPAYGNVNVEFSSQFIFDSEKTSDPTYLSAHMDGLYTAAFTGYYDADHLIPPAGDHVTFSLAMHTPGIGSNPPIMTVYQQTINGAEVFDPVVQLVFYDDNIETGTYPVTAPGADGVTLMVYKAAATPICVIALATEGSIDVTDAMNTSAIEGGTLALNGADIDLYYPAETPVGNLTETLASAGVAVCPRE